MKSLDELKEIGQISNLHSQAYYNSKQWRNGGEWLFGAIITIAIVVAGVAWLFNSECTKALPNWMGPLCAVIAAGIVTFLCVHGGRASCRRHEQACERDALYKRAELIRRAVHAFQTCVVLYGKWYEVSSHGGSIDEEHASAFFDFLLKAKQTIILAESNFKFARNQMEFKGASFNLGCLQELMNALGQQLPEPSLFTFSSTVEDNDSELQETLKTLLSTPFCSQT
jgi:hypothetical protein